jgi:hypothetical protein
MMGKQFELALIQMAGYRVRVQKNDDYREGYLRIFLHEYDEHGARLYYVNGILTLR